MNVLVVNHPYVIQVSERKAREHVENHKGVMVEGILYWHKRPGRGAGEVRPIHTHVDRERGYYGATKCELRVKRSGEYNPETGMTDGPSVVQLEQRHLGLFFQGL